MPAVEEAIENFIGGLNYLKHPTQLNNDEMQDIQNMEVRPTSVGDNLTYLALTARYSYKRLHSSDLALTPSNLIEFVTRKTVGVTTFTGAGLNDGTFSGTYVGTTVRSTYEVEIDATGAPDTFKWRKDAGSYTTGVAITGADQTLAEGVKIKFLATTGHTLGNKWIVTVSPAGTIYLLTGGWDGSANFVVKALENNQTSPITVKSQASINTGITTFLPFNDKVYYTDGNLAWRSWDGLDELASGFTTKTKYGISHKSKAIYANDVTNGVPNALWVSDTGLPELVVASNVFYVGDRGDPIVALIDQVERILIIKERSLWAMYFAPTISDSTLVRGDANKGTLSPLGTVWGGFGTYFYGTDSGIQYVRGVVPKPDVTQLYNFLKGFQNSKANIMFWQDTLWISTKSASGDTRNNRVFEVDLELSENKRVTKQHVPFTLFCLNAGLYSFNKRLKAIEDDGTNRFIVELDQTASTVETNITCLAKTKDFTFKDSSRNKKLNYVVVDALYPNTNNALTIKAFINGSGTAAETLTFTPPATGYQRHKFDFTRHTVRGYRITLQFEYTQPASDAARFALLYGKLDADAEQRVGNDS